MLNSGRVTLQQLVSVCIYVFMHVRADDSEAACLYYHITCSAVLCVLSFGAVDHRSAVKVWELPLNTTRLRVDVSASRRPPGFSPNDLRDRPSTQPVSPQVHNFLLEFLQNQNTCSQRNSYIILILLQPPSYSNDRLLDSNSARC